MNYVHQVFVVLCLGWTATSSVCTFSHHLSYFNEIAGGPMAGGQHLLFSNFDWGQDVLELERVLEAHPEWGPIACWCSETPEGVDIGARAKSVGPNELLPGLAKSRFSHIAVSGNVLAGEWTAYSKEVQPVREKTELSKMLSRLNKQDPAALAGYSIRIFESAEITGRLDSQKQSGDSAHIEASNIDRLLGTLPTLADVSGPSDLGVSQLLHILLLNGFGETCLTKPTTGSEALRLLTDEQFARAVIGTSTLVRTRHGVRYRIDSVPISEKLGGGESHRDQCLATFAALDLPLTFSISLTEETLTIADLLNESIANFTLEQGELAWTTAAYAHYLQPKSTWVDRFGTSTSFSQLLNKLIDGGCRGQSCGGLHMVQSVLDVLEADSRSGILGRKERLRGRQFLTKIIEQAILSQQRDGSWGLNWYEPASPVSQLTQGGIADKIVITGHMLELLCRLEDSPPRPAIIDGTRWLYKALRNLKGTKDLTTQLGSCPLTHALRAIRIACRTHNVSTDELANCLATQ